ncbi:MAG TPA: HAD-IIIC family phosphatase [Candidatus Solibacter sp.]|nr:HAD-IIIC family phosphatase [Candidatus Solibacter sp.]
MNLIDALEILKQPIPQGAPRLKVFLACGFTPLHLQTFLAAHLKKRLGSRCVEIKTGLFGDLVGNIERLEPSSYDALLVVIEWQDLDPRLGIRTLGGWPATDLPDIVKSVDRALGRLHQALRQASSSIPAMVCPPTLPLPPLFTNPTVHASVHELRIRQSVAAFASSISNKPNIKIVNTQNLDELSPPHSRLDVQSELLAGFPYKLPHASAVAESFAALMQTPVPKKGLITDLDDTVWAGILGEVGVNNISWHLDRHTHIHGLYQQFLSSLASAGVLLAIASKNDPMLVEQALERKDLIISKDVLYPIEAHWARKSESVQRILKVWNISHDSVVFIDDSPMEVAEVKNAFPRMECIVFPKTDHQAVWQLLRRLRDLFGKTFISEEDAIRLKSIRGAEALRESGGLAGASLDDFLESAGALMRFNFEKDASDHRAFELINKTNQFNLNGKRLAEAAWIAYLNDPAGFLMTVSYEDKYGPLGKIAVLLGRVNESAIRIDFWVMSCRAFSRRIEHQSLKKLFEKFGAEEISFDYQATPRNGPLQEFLSGLGELTVTSELRLSREVFEERSPSLFHRVEEVVNG